MSELVVKIGIKRDPDMLYFIRDEGVWATHRGPQGESAKVLVHAISVELDHGKYLYFLDGDGDISRTARIVVPALKDEPGAADNLLGASFIEALTLACVIRHRRNERAETPYVAHLLGVAATTLAGGADQKAVIVAVLVEALAGKLDDDVSKLITSHCGSIVAALVTTRLA